MSESAKPSSSEAKELSLIGKVELRIALASTDAELKTTLKTFLAPLLLKLASEHLNVRNKNAPRSVKLPVAALLQQFRQYPSTPLIRHFDLLYIQQGIKRLSITKQLKLLPIIVNGISSDASISASHGAVLFNLLLRILPNLSLPERGSLEDRGLRDQLGLARSEDITFLALWFGKLLLYTPKGPEHVGPTREACPGLSADEYDFLTLHDKKDTWSAGDNTGLNLTETKITIARFLASGVFTDQERFLPALFSSADSNSRISNIGVDLLKRASSNVSLEDPTLIQQLYHIYFGDASSGGPLPVRPALRIQILTLLSKSVIATTFTANVIQVFQEVLTTPEATDGSREFLISPSSREASKMRHSAFSFIMWTSRIGSFADLQVIAPPLVRRLREYVEGQGWPNPNDDARSAQYLSLRGMAYQSIGILAMHSPRELLLEPNLDLLHWLFKALSEDASGSEIAVSVEEAIGSVLNCFKTGLDWDVEEGLRSLLLHHMTLDDGAMSDHNKAPTQVRRSTRFVAVRFANRCLRYSDVVARWIDLIAIGGRPGERQEVIEEGQKGLSPYWYQILNPLGERASRGRGSAAAKPIVQFPVFSEMIEFIMPRITYSSRVEQQELLPNLSLNKQTLDIVAPAATFCRAILISQALVSVERDIKFDVDWDRKLDSAMSSDELARAATKAYLKPSSTEGDDEKTKAISTFLLVLYNGMVWNHGEGLPKCGEYLVDVCALCSNAMLSHLAPHVVSWTSSIWSNKHDTRTTAAHAFGILASHPDFPSEELQKLLVTLLNKARTWKSAVGAGINQVHGSILALGFLWGRLKLRAHLDTLPETDLHVFVALIFDILAESGQRTLQEAVVTAIDQLCLFSVLRPAQIPPEYTPNVLVDKMIEKARSGNDKAILALGHFAMSLKESKSEDSLHNQILNRLYALHDVRQPEVQFAVGEALTCAATGWDSKSLVAVLDVEESPPDLAKPGAELSDVLIQVLSHCKSTKPAMRKASAIWLLCIVQFNGHAPCVQRSLRQCQAAFKRFLADRDSLVQETASRGLALVYEKGGKQLKDDLVRDLMASFISTNANLGGSVAEDTELFEPGALPTAEGSVTTYKDIMSLASEVGDPSLVYRFMSLASHDAIWSSRAAFGRFGLDTLLSDSSIDGYLAQNPKLYPKLFRYRFDPNPNVQRAMNDIWVATVKDPASILEEHFDEIMDDLLRNILGKEWRVRQACCAAIADLVQGSHFEKYEKHLNEIWAKSFKVVDDIKLSVRTAAMALVRVLAGILIRNLEAGESAGKKASSMLQQVVPFLLSSSGLEASAREIQQYALTTLLSIIKKSSGKHLKPFIPVLVERILALLSSLEPEAVNYIHLNASKYDLTEEKIDEIRLTSVRGSPMMEAIERCLDQLDEPTTAALSPALEDAMKSALGLPSKVSSYFSHVPTL
ncbi:MAG: proteasome component M29 [Candelina submexicana]|nr:MAG: proteasome component M29 [Candelina submexicana]